MKIEELKELADFMAEEGITVLEIEEDDKKVRLERQSQNTAALPSVPSAPAEKKKEESSSSDSVGGTSVKSPMVGVFYAAPSPEEKPFVSVGDKVKKGDVLCIIEAMKLMNEIVADVDGEIAKICVSDGQVVEYGQCLFIIH